MSCLLTQTSHWCREYELALGTGACDPLRSLPSAYLVQGAEAVRQTACGVGFPLCWGPPGTVRVLSPRRAQT